MISFLLREKPLSDAPLHPPAASASGYFAERRPCLPRRATPADALSPVFVSAPAPVFRRHCAMRRAADALRHDAR